MEMEILGAQSKRTTHIEYDMKKARSPVVTGVSGLYWTTFVIVNGGGGGN